MYRAPYSHLSWDDAHYRDYWDHLKTVSLDARCGDPDLPRQDIRRRRREFIALRENLYRVGHTFEGIERWINENSRAILLNPCLGARGQRNKGFVFKFYLERWPCWKDSYAYGAPRDYGGTLVGEITEGPGWRAKGHIDVPSNILSAPDYMNALSALGLCVTDYSFDGHGRSKRLERRKEFKDKPEVYANRYFIEMMIFGNDFYSLAMLEKLHERAIDRGPDREED